MATGKYQEWLTEDGLLMIMGWARDGLSDIQIAHNIGIAEGTFYRWQNEHSQIKEALKKGKAPVDTIVENALFKRACGYDWEEITTETSANGNVHEKRVIRHVPPDTAAAIFWLKNRKSHKWRDKPTVETAEADNEAFSELIKAINGEKT